MKLTILGNNGPYPAKGGACSGYLITSDSGETQILIDCGTGVLSRLMETTSLSDIDAVILSHLHFDHMSDMLPMQYALQFNPREKPLPVIAPKGPEAVRRLLECPAYDLWPVEDTVIGEMRISFSPARHPVETYAVCITCDNSKFVFTGDSNQDLLMEFFCDGADLLLADAGLSKDDHSFTAPHYSAELCGQLARNAHAKKLVLTHFNPKYNPEDLLAEARSAFEDTVISEIGKSYYL
ncbi:MAG: MBL fold metallo-hydrolase [Clostridia bacterium]|nr:MBL fold metallo-hydrolase [Clostridia bacterium]